MFNASIKPRLQNLGIFSFVNLNGPVKERGLSFSASVTSEMPRSAGIVCQTMCGLAFCEKIKKIEGKRSIARIEIPATAAATTEQIAKLLQTAGCMDIQINPTP